MAKAKSEVSTAQLLARIEALEKDRAQALAQLTESERARLAAEAALASNETTSDDMLLSVMSRQVQEQHIGKRKVTVQVYNTKKKEYVEEERELDFYRYLVDLPPSGGIEVRLGPNVFLHGQVAVVDYNTLRSLKEVVHRSWAHEAQINGRTDQVWGRKPLSLVLRGGQGGVR